MELRDYLRILRERWILLIACTLAGLLAAGVMTLSMTPVYQATSQVYVSVQTQDGSTQNLVQGSTFTQSQVAGFADLATSPLVLEPVIEAEGIAGSANALAGRVSAAAKLNTSLIDITATGELPAEAADLSNAVAASMATVLPELQRPLDSAVSPVRITITRTAAVPTTAASPNVNLNLAVGMLLGLFVAIGAALLKATLDTRVRSEEDLRNLTDRPVLASVGYDESTPADPLVMSTHPLSHRAEAIRRLRTNLQFINAPGRPRKIVVTSAVPGEGKSTTSANLALAMADAGSRVVLVDADLRRPTIATTFGIESAVGLTTVLIGNAQVTDVLQSWQGTSLDILPCGEIPPNPSELLGSQQMVSILNELAQLYDVVLLDSAPLLPVTDGAVLARLTDGALVVVSADSAHRTQVREALDALETVEARVLGLVLNRANVDRDRNYRYYDYTLDTSDSPAQRSPSRRKAITLATTGSDRSLN